MLGLCPHDFLWPRKAADGNYYQVCRLCGAEHKYDWTNMRRMRRMPRTAAKPKPASAPVLWSSKPSRKPAPRLKLLLELEPGYRVFFGNLVEMLRPASPVATTSKPAPFWPDVFIPSVMPWRRFSESLLFHTIAVAIIFILSQPWAQPNQPSQRRAFQKTHISYYTPSQTFPALRGSQTPLRPRKKKRESTGQAAMKVKPESVPGSIRPPDIKLPGQGRPDFVASNIGASSLVAPAIPLAATRGSQLTVPAGPTTVVAPPPDVYQATSRRSGLPIAMAQGQGLVVAPAPEVGGAGLRQGMGIPSAVVVAPAPMVQAAMRRLGDVNIGPSAVVAPAPQLPMDERHVMSGSGQGHLGGRVSMAVPPPPSLQGSRPLPGGRAGSLSGTGAQVVPPAPSVQDPGNASGGRRVGSFAGTGLQVVPPAPSMQDAGNSNGNRRGGALSSAGLQAVPPAPTVQGTGNSMGGGRAGSLSGAGLQGVPPAPQGEGAGSFGAGGRQMAMNIKPAISPAAPPVVDNPKEPDDREPGTEEMPLRVIGLALALPNSSYFSNYEVFIAEKRLRKNRGQLIKLVYVSLPYQRRLSEYGVDNTKIYRLRVTRDRTCDESLMQMTWPETDPRPDAKNVADAPALSSEDRNNMLPCYRTTADDYRRAISRSH